MSNKKRRFGDRYDGRKIRTLPPMEYISPFVMKTRNDASNLFQNKAPLFAIENYVRQKRREGFTGFGFMHVAIAAYVRTVSQFPAINRFISGQRIYQREDIVLSMMIKKTMELNSQETGIKVILSPTDTATDVFTKVEAAIALARQEGDSTSLDFVARALVKLPSLILRGFVGLMNTLDYFGIMPKSIHEASPFHASIFMSNLGSLGIPPVFHHLYNFGNVPVFLTFGSKYSVNELQLDGSVKKTRYIDYTVVSDERITDGHYFAQAFKCIDRIFKKPSILDNPPDEVVEDSL